MRIRWTGDFDDEARSALNHRVGVKVWKEAQDEALAAVRDRLRIESEVRVAVERQLREVLRENVRMRRWYEKMVGPVPDEA